MVSEIRPLMEEYGSMIRILKATKYLKVKLKKKKKNYFCQNLNTN